MSTLAELTAQLTAGRDLVAGEVNAAAEVLVATAESDEAKAAFLSALTNKGETAAEVAFFARAFRARSLNPGVESWSPTAIDIVGTGGDHTGGFNISSLVVLTLASAGVTVMKHGNRGITSKCGSADLLAALGVNLEASPEKIRGALKELGYVFFYAPAYHPAFKHIAPVRKILAARGKRSVFNILGTLINPGRPAHVLLGVFAEPWVEKLSGALESLGASGGIAAHGIISPGFGIDELTTATLNRVKGFGRLRDVNRVWSAEDFGLSTAPFAELQGGDLATNVAIVDALLAGRGPGGLVDTIVLNAAVGMWIVGKVSSVTEGIGPARELLLGGAVAKKIEATKAYYLS